MAAKKDFVVKNGLVVGTTQDSATPGQLSWNSSEGTVDLSLQNGVTLQLGQEQHFYAKATEAIANGDVVMFAGAQGDHLLISKADVTTPGFIDEWVVGVATQAFATNDFGYVTSFGKVNELNTSAPGWQEGDLLYLDPATPGGLTTTRPTSPDHEILIAAVVRVNPAEGSIFVRPNFGAHLQNLHDVIVDSDTLTNNQFLVYDSSSSVWNNQTVTTSIIGEGSNLYYTSTRVDSDITSLVDSAYINARVSTTDSAQVVSIINDTVDQTFVNNLNVNADTLDNQDGTYYLDYTNFTNTPNVLDSADVLATVTADGFTKYDSANASGQITTAINNLVDGAPLALDTLNELAAALNDDANFAATVTGLIEALPDSAQVSAIITADVDKAFVDNLNVDADTLDSQDGTYYLDYNNFTNTPNVLDSADVTNIVDSDYINARVDGTSSSTAVDIVDSSLSQNIVDSFPKASFRGGEYLITSEANANYGLVKVFVVHNGFGASVTSLSNLGGIGSFDAQIDSSDTNVELLYTPVDSSCTISFIRTLIPNTNKYSEFPTDLMEGSGTIDLMQGGGTIDLQ